MGLMLYREAHSSDSWGEETCIGWRNIMFRVWVSGFRASMS